MQITLTAEIADQNFSAQEHRRQRRINRAKLRQSFHELCKADLLAEAIRRLKVAEVGSLALSQQIETQHERSRKVLYYVQGGWLRGFRFEVTVSKPDRADDSTA